MYAVDDKQYMMIIARWKCKQTVRFSWWSLLREKWPDHHWYRPTSKIEGSKMPRWLVRCCMP